MKTKKAITIYLGIIFFSLMTNPIKAFSGMSVNIGIGVPLPQVVIHGPPPVVVVPGTYVYFAPDVGVDIFFYHGFWYRPHNGHWYRARGYDGPWDNIRRSRVPHVVRNLPPDFRRRVRHHERIRYSDLRRNWKTWEKKKHWDRHDYRRGKRHDNGYEAGNAHNRWGRKINNRKQNDWQEVREVRDDREGGSPENNQIRRDRKGRHGR